MEQRANPLLKRTEYRFEIGHSGQSTPSRESIRAELSRDLHVPKDRVVVEGMHSKFGTPKTLGAAMVYATSDDAKAVEREHILKRNRLVETAAAESPPSAETAPAPGPAKPAEPAGSGSVHRATEKPAEKAGPQPTKAPAEKGGHKTTKPSEESADKPPEKDGKPAGTKPAAKPKET